ncbi:Ger(x)C family spore germination protein [Paenibacillus sp. 1011MAR3C5]|uniref:Ger(x)C family spore germination protein n=1 Tax=Paenibacillus sp. 1011MAR3C5 TaxID=1675787 RepID=UPI000E6D06FE|nr:Ger(x)C family spore germination protein [Paenibacillus sp. 1011MAR3C5]RJE86964.1 Ger(x)C family spore germination protein [Paenibacillus sp. 1011MAR3C5]
MRPALRKLALTGLAACCLTGCWDRTEINELAIVGLVGSEENKDTGSTIVYYQIVNPAAFSQESGRGGTSPVYTYKVEGKSRGEMGHKSAESLPRKLFTDHYQTHVITESLARKGLRPFVNFYERQYNRRSSLLLFITDSELSDVMMTYTPLEQLPGRTLRSLVYNTNKSTGRISLKSRVKDLVENMESTTCTVLPIISLRDSKPFLTTKRFETIEANRSNLILSGAAVFKQDRMIGKIGLRENGYYNLLKGETSSFFQSITLDNMDIDLSANKIKVTQSLSTTGGAPVWNVTITANLAIHNNEQTEKLTWENLSRLTDEFNREVSDTAGQLYQKALKKGWDLFGLEDKIKNKRGKAWKAIQGKAEAWKETKLNLTVNSSVNNVGEIINPYEGGLASGKE